jgi:hypothetical protein
MVLGHEQAGDQAPVSKDLPREIASLKAHYCQWLDGKEWDRWASLFTEDAIMQVGPTGEAAVRGRSAIQKLLTRQLKRARTLHQVWEPEVTVESSVCQRVVWEMKDRVETPLYVLEGGGFYEPEVNDHAGNSLDACQRLACAVVRQRGSNPRRSPPCRPRTRRTTMSTTALLTGAAGRVGKYVIGALARRGIEVVATDIVSKGIPVETRFEQCDLTDANAVRRLVSLVKPDVVVHCAAVVAPIAYAEPELAEAVNLGGTRHLIDATKTHAPDAFWRSDSALDRSVLAG